jgi:hypothetical protein
VAEGEQPAGAQQAGDLGNGAVGVGEVHRPVVTEHEVEAGVGQWHGLGAGLDQGHVDACVGEQPASVSELAFGEVEANRPGAGPGQVDRPLGGAAAQFEDVAAGDVAEHVQLRLGEVPGAPGLAVAGELLAVSCLVVIGVGVPGGPVAPLVSAEAGIPRRDLRRAASWLARIGRRWLWRFHSTQPTQHQVLANRPRPLTDARVGTTACHSSRPRRAGRH